MNMWKFKTYMMPGVAFTLGFMAAALNCCPGPLGMVNVYLTSLALLAFEAAR
jgi:hypothetical protein